MPVPISKTSEPTPPFTKYFTTCDNIGGVLQTRSIEKNQKVVVFKKQLVRDTSGKKTLIYVPSLSQYASPSFDLFPPQIKVLISSDSKASQNGSSNKHNLSQVAHDLNSTKSSVCGCVEAYCNCDTQSTTLPKKCTTSAGENNVCRKSTVEDKNDELFSGIRRKAKELPHTVLDAKGNTCDDVFIEPNRTSKLITDQVLTSSKTTDAMISRPETKSKYVRKTTFAVKLMRILSNETYHNSIAWLPNGDSFVIVCSKTLSSDVLPQFFKETKFGSFMRKLYRWGFKRATKNKDELAFHHKLFQRDQPELCKQMRGDEHIFSKSEKSIKSSQRPSIITKNQNKVIVHDSAALSKGKKSFQSAQPDNDYLKICA